MRKSLCRHFAIRSMSLVWSPRSHSLRTLICGESEGFSRSDIGTERLEADFWGSRGNLYPWVSGLYIISWTPTGAFLATIVRTRGHSTIELRWVIKCTKLGVSLTCRVPWSRQPFESRLVVLTEGCWARLREFSTKSPTLERAIVLIRSHQE